MSFEQLLDRIKGLKDRFKKIKIDKALSDILPEG